MDFEQARERALCILDIRIHSAYELKRKLIQKGVENEIADAVIADLEDYGIINDREYARIFAEHLSENKKFGKHRIKQELAQKGIDSSIISDTVAELETDESTVLYPLVENKLGGDFERKSIDRTVRYFANRGYSVGDIFKCIDLVREEAENGI